MFRITNTGNLMGIVIHGDYNDLNELGEALRRFSELYYELFKKLYETEYPGGENEERRRRKIVVPEKNMQRFFRLFIELICACKGAGTMEFTDNNSSSVHEYGSSSGMIPDLSRKYEAMYKKSKHGNLQFNTEVMYPHALYYYFTARKMISEIYENKSIRDIRSLYKESWYMYHGKRSDYIRDIGMMIRFAGELEAAISEAVGEEYSGHLMDYIDRNAYQGDSLLYTAALCRYYIRLKERPDKVKRVAVCLMAYELYNGRLSLDGAEHSDAKEDYKKITDLLERENCSFVTRYMFGDKVADYVNSLSLSFLDRDCADFLSYEFGKISDEEWKHIYDTEEWPKNLLQDDAAAG